MRKPVESDGSALVTRIREMVPEIELWVDAWPFDDVASAEPWTKFVDEDRRRADYDCGRVRFFLDALLAGKKLHPIEFDCSYSFGAWTPHLQDGRHRLVASIYADVTHIDVSWSGPLVIRDYIIGRTNAYPYRALGEAREHAPRKRKSTVS